VERKRVWYIVSKIDMALSFEWISLNLDATTIDLTFILLNAGDSQIEEFFKENGVNFQRVKFSGVRSYPSCFAQLWVKMIVEQPDVVHTHMVDATTIGLFASLFAGIRKRVLTRHHSTFHHRFYRKGVIKDRILNFIATDIIAISKNVETILVEREGVSPDKVRLVHHGFDLDYFKEVATSEVERLVVKYNPGRKGPVIGVISRWIEWKGVLHIVLAFERLLSEYPNALLVLANASASKSKDVTMKLKELPDSSYVTIKFEQAIAPLYKLFDVFVHAPIDGEIEAFGQTYVESLAAGITSIFTLSGIANEFIVHEKNALVVPYEQSMPIYFAMKRLIEDDKLRNELKSHGQQSLQKFELSLMIQKLESLYLF